MKYSVFPKLLLEISAKFRYAFITSAQKQGPQCNNIDQDSYVRKWTVIFKDKVCSRELGEKKGEREEEEGERNIKPKNSSSDEFGNTQSIFGNRVMAFKSVLDIESNSQHLCSSLNCVTKWKGVDASYYVVSNTGKYKFQKRKYIKIKQFAKVIILKISIRLSSYDISEVSSLIQNTHRRLHCTIFTMVKIAPCTNICPHMRKTKYIFWLN